MAVAQLGYEIDSSGAIVAETNLDKMTAAAVRAEKAENVLSGASKGASGSLSSVSVSASEAARAVTSAQQSANIAAVSFDGLGQSIVDTQREAVLYRAEMDAIRAQFNPLFAASKQYEEQLDRIASAERLGAISATEASEARNRASNQLNLANGQMAVASTKMARFSKETGAGAAQTANLGAQLNDIGVMLAAGQNPLQLAVQQGTQINQVFAQMGGGANALRGIAAGFASMINPMSLATIGVIAGTAALTQWAVAAWGSEDAADALEARYDSLAAITGSLSDASEILNMNIVELTETYGDAAERVREFALLTAELRIAELNESISNHVGILAEVSERYFTATDAGRTYRNTLARIGEDFGLTGAAAREFETTIERLATADSFDKQVAALQDIDALLRANGVSASEIPPELAKALAEMIELSNETDAARKIADDLAATVSDIENNTYNAVDATNQWAAGLSAVLSYTNAIGSVISSLGGGAISAAAKQTEIAALQAGNSLKDAARSAAIFKENLEVDAKVSELEGRFGKVGTAMGAILRGQVEYNRELDVTLDKEREAALEREKAAAKAEKASRSSAKSAAKKAAAEAKRLQKEYTGDLTSLIESLRTERETLEAWHDESEALLNDRRAVELLGVQGHNDAKLALDKEYLARKKEITDEENSYVANAQSAALQSALGFLSTLGSQSKAAAVALIAVNTGLSVAEAIQNTAVAATKALAIYGPTPAGAAAVAQVQAFGAAQVAAIVANGALNVSNAVSGGGGGSSSSSSSSTPSAGTASTEAPTQEVIIQVVGGKTRFSVDELNEIIDGIREESGDGRAIIAGFTT